jgi:hypothetical protein
MDGVPAINEELVKDVLRYFLRHPRAADTLEGVSRWRLLEVKVDRRIEETQGALAWLVARGFLKEHTTVASGRIFRLTEEKRTEAERFLAGTERPESG